MISRPRLQRAASQIASQITGNRVRPRLRTGLMPALLASLLLTTLAAAPAAAEVIHEERSLYRNILVRQIGDERCLLFTIKRADRNQSCINLADPDRLVFPYARMMLGGLMVNPAPERILMIGLGGGTLPRLYASLLPDTHQDLVEIDSAVVRVARDYFLFEETPQMQVHVRDARVFVKRALSAGQTYDYIMLDAFTGDYIPEHLLSQEFLEEVRGILAPGGVVVANTFASSGLYDHESATYDAVFDSVAELRLPVTLNRILIATDAPWPDLDTRLARAEALAPQLRRFRVDPTTLARNMKLDYAYDRDARLLTDQYSPANLLRDQ
ncbi:MAG TPA: fused MFS/spermidine synthase [Pseudomonadales bacterium]|nr:fused MFS/spermidine synthase [Pseudomonadales bacterium]